MVFLNNDCIIYQFEESLSLKRINYELTSTTFEKFTIEKLSSEILEVTFTWLDPIRVHEKLVLRDQKEVTFWFYLEQNIMIMWNSSESLIGYTLRKIEKKLEIKLKQIDIVRFAKNPLVFSNFAELTSIHIIDENTSLNGIDESFNFDKRVSLRKIDHETYNYYQVSSLITSYTFYVKSKDLHFYIDKKGIVSFSEAVKVVDKVYVLEKLIYKIK